MRSALLRRLCYAAALCLTPLIPTHAADYPERPIHLLVGFPPGGGADFVARQAAQRLGTALNTSVVVDNKPGANGTIAAADGYTLLLAVTASQAISPALSPKLPYDPVRDFSPITELGYTPLVIVVNPKLPVKTLSDFLAYAKHASTPLTYGSAGVGNITHMAAAFFAQAAGIENFRHIPYKGSSQAVTDLIGGRIDVYFDTLPASLPFIQAGQLRALAVTGPARSASAPGIPTVAEAGVPGFETTTWFGLLAPAGLKPELAQRLADAMRQGMSPPAARQAMTSRGVEPVLDTPDKFMARMQTDLATWKAVAAKGHITLE